jgi:hypothetical protein
MVATDVAARGIGKLFSFFLNMNHSFVIIWFY